MFLNKIKYKQVEGEKKGKTWTKKNKINKKLNFPQVRLSKSNNNKRKIKKQHETIKIKSP